MARVPEFRVETISEVHAGTTFICHIGYDQCTQQKERHVSK